MNHTFLKSARCGALFSFAVVALTMGGCGYTGVGNLTIENKSADAGGVGIGSTDLTGTFDRYLSREDSDVYTFTAYQKIAKREKFGQYHRNYKKDAQFVQAELIVRINKAGTIVGEPRLILRQGDRILTDGPLQGDVKVEPRDNQLMISGDALNWRFDEAMSHAVSFELLVHNVLTPPPAPAAPTQT